MLQKIITKPNAKSIGYVRAVNSSIRFTPLPSYSVRIQFKNLKSKEDKNTKAKSNDTFSRAHFQEELEPRTRYMDHFQSYSLDGPQVIKKYPHYLLLQGIINVKDFEKIIDPFFTLMTNHYRYAERIMDDVKENRGVLNETSPLRFMTKEAEAYEFPDHRFSGDFLDNIASKKQYEHVKYNGYTKNLEKEKSVLLQHPVESLTEAMMLGKEWTRRGLIPFQSTLRLDSTLDRLLTYLEDAKRYKDPVIALDETKKDFISFYQRHFLNDFLKKNLNTKKVHSNSSLKFISKSLEDIENYFDMMQNILVEQHKNFQDHVEHDENALTNYIRWLCYELMLICFKFNIPIHSLSVANRLKEQLTNEKAVASYPTLFNYYNHTSKIGRVKEIKEEKDENDEAIYFERRKRNREFEIIDKDTGSAEIAAHVSVKGKFYLLPEEEIETLEQELNRKVNHLHSIAELMHHAVTEQYEFPQDYKSRGFNSF